MKFGAAVIGVAMLIGSGLFAPPAQASYTVTLAQVGRNVVATGSGTLDLAGLEFGGHSPGEAGISPSNGGITTGPAGSLVGDIYARVMGPASFGSGGFTPATSGNGAVVAIEISQGNQLLAPEDYVSGDPISDSSTYDGQTFASLGVTPGTYVWTWGNAGDDSFTLIIPAAAVPEPSSLALLALPLGLVMLLATRWALIRSSVIST
jgi:hypothetical protein